jgi:hypothetical protein
MNKKKKINKKKKKKKYLTFNVTNQLTGKLILDKMKIKKKKI